MRQRVTIDCETWPITPTDLAPPLVCVSFYRRGDFFGVVQISPPDAALDELAHCFGHCIVVGHRICYDLAVILRRFPTLRPVVEQALREGRIRDTRIREAMVLGLPEPWRAGVDTGLGADDSQRTWKAAVGADCSHALALAACALRYTGHVIKESGWGMRFQELDGVPLADWPADAVVYCGDDVRETDAVFDAQGGMALDETAFVALAWAFHQKQVAARAAAGGTL